MGTFLGSRLFLQPHKTLKATLDCFLPKTEGVGLTNVAKNNYGHESLEFGPGRHGVAGAFYLYAHEPGGNRIEVNTPEALIFAPDWKLVRWLASQNPLMYWGCEVPF